MLNVAVTVTFWFVNVVISAFASGAFGGSLSM